jgi:hypothetical protein
LTFVERGLIVGLAETFCLEIFMMRFLIIVFGIAVLGASCLSACAANTSQGQSVTSPASHDSNGAAPAVKRVVVWDGEQASTGAGWTNPTTATIKPQTVEAHSGNTALEFRFKGDKGWLGAGWNWLAFKTGIVGTQNDEGLQPEDNVRTSDGFYSRGRNGWQFFH